MGHRWHDLISLFLSRNAGEKRDHIEFQVVLRNIVSTYGAKGQMHFLEPV
jgi:hypothetical protein